MSNPVRNIAAIVIAAASFYFAGHAHAADVNNDIQLLSSLSAPSVTNGEELSITVLAKSPSPIISATAFIGDINETIPLSLSSGTPNSGIYSARWTAHGLIEKVYTVSLTFTNANGDVTVDNSLSFTDPLFGNTTTGSTSYPNDNVRRTAALTLESGENQLLAGVVDTANGFAYFSTLSSPGKIIKIRLSDFTRVGSITLTAGLNNPRVGAIDTLNGFAYFATSTDGTFVVKIDLATFTQVASLGLAGGARFGNAIVIDSVHSTMYVSGYAGQKISKVDLTSFTQTAVLTLNAGEVSVDTAALVDATGTYAYFATQGTPGKVVKIQLSDFTRVGALTLNAGENNPIAAFIDTTNGFAYFGTCTASAGIITKVQLSDFTRVGSLTVSSGTCLRFAVYDSSKSRAYFITSDSPSRMIAINTSTFTEASNIAFNSGENGAIPLVYDDVNKILYSATFTSPSKVVKFSTSYNGFISGTKVTLSETGNITHVSMYSHAASGSLRAAIYDSNKHLVWQSDPKVNTTAGDIINFPIANGTPAILKLDAGTYYLAFQTSSTSGVPSYAAGSSGDGFYYAQEYGSFPSAISGETSSNEIYTIYAGYEGQTSSGGSGSSSGGSGSVPSTPSTPTTPPETPPVIPPIPVVGHPVGSLIKDATGTIFMIAKDGTVVSRRPYTSAASFLSYKYNSFSAVQDANAVDMSLAAGSFIPPRDGSIICSDRNADKGTCYVISEGTKRGIVSEAVFKSFGYKFQDALTGDVSFLPVGSVIAAADQAHPVGTLVLNGSTLQIVSPTGLFGIPSVEVLQSWGFSISDQLASNTYDRSLSQTSVLQIREPGQISIAY